jgi:integrase
MRSSDIKALTLDCINWHQRTITISQFKTHREVVLPITDEVFFALLDYIKNARPQTAYQNVFIRLRKPYVPYSMNDHFGDKIAPFFEIAGVSIKGKHHGLHSLRHSLATNLLNTGTPVNEIAVILGHTSASSTKTYIWSDLEHLRIAAMEVPGND